MLRSRGTPFRSVDDTLQLFQNAGFIDIQVVEKLIDLGDWRREGIFYYNIITHLDPHLAAARRNACFSFGCTIPVLVKKFEDFLPDEDQRRNFSERALAELGSGKYHLSLKMLSFEI